MNVTEMYVASPSYYTALYSEIKNIPFYKVEKGYRYAAYILENKDDPSDLHAFLNGTGKYLYEGETEELKEVKNLYRGALKRLAEVEISDEDLTAWITFKKEFGGIKEYHQILEELYENLMLANFEASVKTADVKGIERVAKEGDSPIEQKVEMVAHYWGDTVSYQDKEQLWERKMDGKKDLSEKFSSNVVLNHNNPFADISIKDQQFIYGSTLGQFETMRLTTSLTLTKVPKDTERSYMVLQPGFKIKKGKVDLSPKTRQDVTFDDTLTTEVAQADDNVYVYVD